MDARIHWIHWMAAIDGWWPYGPFDFGFSSSCSFIYLFIFMLAKRTSNEIRKNSAKQLISWKEWQINDIINGLEIITVQTVPFIIVIIQYQQHYHLIIHLSATDCIFFPHLNWLIPYCLPLLFHRWQVPENKFQFWSKNQPPRRFRFVFSGSLSLTLLGWVSNVQLSG